MASFRSRHQQGNVCGEILALVGCEDLWLVTNEPTEKALQLAGGYEGTDASALTTEQRTMLRLVLDLHQDSGTLRVTALLMGLDGKALRSLGQLFAAIAAGPDAIEVWLFESKVRRLSASAATNERRATTLEAGGGSAEEVSELRRRAREDRRRVEQLQRLQTRIH